MSNKYYTKKVKPKWDEQSADKIKEYLERTLKELGEEDNKKQ